MARDALATSLLTSLLLVCSPRRLQRIAVLGHSKHVSNSLRGLLARRPFNVVVVALANKMARTIWVLLAHACAYQPGYVAHAT